MKKLILFAAILFAGVSVVKADEPVATTTNDNTTLRVLLIPFQTITVNPADGHKKVDLVYDEADKYKDGVSSNELEDHLTVQSTGAFSIAVYAKDLENGSNDKTIKASTINISATKGTSELVGATSYSIDLANSNKTLISSKSGGINKTFNITYTGANDDLYTDNYIVGHAETVYTTTVIYTITAN